MVGISAIRAMMAAIDDGSGMTRQNLARYHDLATTSKRRGRGIGFAGVGLKLGLLVAEDVVTETRRGKTHVATTWRLATRYRAPWKWVPPGGMTGERGTAVRLRLANPLSPLLDSGYLEEALRTHFAPLLDPAYADLLRRHYPQGVALDVDGQALSPARPLLRDRRLRVDFQLPTGTVPVLGDAVQLERVLLNLLSNAATFTPSGGHVTVSVQPAPEAESPEAVPHVPEEVQANLTPTQAAQYWRTLLL